MGLKDQLAGSLPAEALLQISDHFDVIGDIAVLGLSAGLEPYKQRIARAIVAKRRSVSTVLNKKEKVGGDARTARYEVLWGTSTVTLHREFGYTYHLDISRTFFCSRMANERKRVTDQVRPGEKVYVPFAGVGPFAIPAAARGAEVCAVEKSPDAARYLRENIALNHVTDNCHALQGNAFDIACLPHRVFDRLIIPAPYGMDHALDALLPLLSQGGMAHVYTFRTKEQIPGLAAAYAGKGLNVTYSSLCGNVAPGVGRWVFDLSCPALQ